MKSNLTNWVTRLTGLFRGSTGNNQTRETELEDAKKMFLHYGCNHFYMMREGDLDKYKKYHISKEQEQQWHDEYIAYWLERLSVDNLTALRHLRNSWNHKIIPTLIDMAGGGDSYAKFWFAYTILDLSKSQTKMRKQGRETAIELFKSIVKNKVEISEQHRTEITKEMIVALNASSPEEYLINYSKRKLTELRVKLSDL